LICSLNFLFFSFFGSVFEYIHCNKIKILTNSNQQTQSYRFTSHITAFLSVVLITEMLEICIKTSYDQNVQLILKSYLPVVYGNSSNPLKNSMLTRTIFIYSVTYKVNLFGKEFTHVRNCLRKEKHMYGTNKNIDGFYTKTTQIWGFRVKKKKKSVIPTYSIFQLILCNGI
jgi:hypothetical protein